MSWWDSSGFTNFASQASKALKNAQKKIDKVLDIDEGGNTSGASQQSQTKEKDSSWSSDSWSSWSMSLDTDKSPKTTSVKESSSDEKSSVFEKSSLNRKPLDSLKAETKTENLSGEELSFHKSNVQSKGKVFKTDTDKSEIKDNSEKQTKSEDNDKTEIKNENSHKGNKTMTDHSVEKSITDHESGANILTGSLSSSFDKLSCLSGDTTSSDSQSFEKVPSTEKFSAEDVVSLHSIESINDNKQPMNLESDSSKNENESTKVDCEKISLVKTEQNTLCEISGTGTAEIGAISSVEGSLISVKTELPVTEEVHSEELEKPSDFGDTSITQTLQLHELMNEMSVSSEKDSKQENIETDTDENRILTDQAASQSDISVDETDSTMSNRLQTDNIVDKSDGTLPDSHLEIKQSNDSSVNKSSESQLIKETLQNESISVSECNNEVDIEPTSNEEITDNEYTPLSPVHHHHIRSGSSESHDDQPSSPLTNSSSGEGSKLDSSIDTDDTVVDPGTKADSDSMESVSPSSSYVKCMIQEAMDDSVKVEDNSSDGHSVGKSECSRSTGGHESGDEVDTTTSSDIEIISTPTSNGDSSKFIDLSPLKIALQKTARRNDGTHRRNDSHDSQSSNSSHSHGDQMSPGRDTDSSEDGMEMKITSEESKAPLCRELPPLDEEVADPYNTQKLLKKLAEMAEVLQAREDKLVVLSKENVDLVETNNILRNQLQQIEDTRAVEMEDVDQVTKEFTQRLSDSEKMYQQAVREKESIKKQYEEVQADFQKKMIKLDNALQEKEQTITELLQEGEKLSKQQLQSNNIVKKLRTKEKETDSLVTGYRKKIDEQSTELEHLKKVLDSKEEMEKKQTEAINQLNAAVQKQERELTKFRSIENDSNERVRGLQTALDNSYKEIAELNKSKAALDNQAQAAALSQEMHIREELKATLEREQLNFKHEKEALIMQIEDLRLSMQRMEKEHNRREDMLRQEISDLQMQLQEDEARNQDLSHSVTSATRPLLRQIENLQSTFAAQSASWEKVEKNLSDRLYEAQTQLAAVTERERSATEKLMDINTQITSLESQNSHLRQDKSQLNAQLEIMKSKVEVLEDAKNSEAAQLNAFKQKVSQDMADQRKEKVFLETQLDMEKTKLEQEKKKFQLAQEQITQLERDLQRPKSRESTHSPVSISRTESVSSYTDPPNLMLSSLTQDDIDRSFILGTQKTSLYDSLRHSGAANLLENLQSQLKLREGEITQLQSDIQQLERTRESMARELVNLTNQNESLQEKNKELPQIQEQLQEVNQRYNALLQMYGEKVEEADELRLDLNDVKDMYKMQIDHLLAK